jgi:DNA-binding Lrp family transcriptional regulator
LTSIGNRNATEQPILTTRGDSPLIDDLDARFIALLAAEPRLGMVACARRLGVARGTAIARLERLLASGVVRGFGPEIDPAALGYTVTAFTTLEIQQGRGGSVAGDLAQVPEVLEAHTITGPGDVLCRVVARSNAHLQQVIDRVLAIEGIERASTVIALSQRVPQRVLPLVAQASRHDAGTTTSGRPRRDSG